MTNTNPDASKVRELGWRQGSVLPPSLFVAVEAATGLSFKEGESFPVVVTQDCDVACDNYEDEPLVEIVRAVLNEKPDGNLRHFKSARRLQVDALVDGTPRLVQFNTVERRFLDRRILEGAAPDDRITIQPKDVPSLARWIAYRFRRASFPDAFDRRLDSAKKELRKLFSAWGDGISAVFVHVHPDNELPDTEVYELTAYLTVLAEVSDAAYEKLENELLPKCQEILDGIQGITLVDLMLVSEKVFTLDDARQSRRMDFDSITYKKGGTTVDDS